MRLRHRRRTDVIKFFIMRRIAAAFAFLLLATAAAFAARKPNFIIIFTDDQGYGDVGVYGSPNIKTPNLDRMAQEGVKFTSFYAAPFCGPSRAALMTGCYPPRVSLAFNHTPGAKTGINPDEITIAELLKTQGYATMIIGKWHLGDAPEFRPIRHGFDHWYGLPYSNDMWPYHPKMPPRPNEDERMKAARARAALTGYAGQGTYFPPGGGFPQPLALMRDDEVLALNPDQTRFTSDYTNEALKFITANKDRPFFLYLPHSMPHVPLFRSKRFEGVSLRGLYGDVVQELDWSVGQILAKLKELGLDEDTLVFFTSDNGPWLQYGIDGGSAGPLRAGKGTCYEGGMRVPAIARWPGKIPAGLVTTEVAANMDLYPTLAKLAGAKLPTDRIIDGRDIFPLMSQPGARTPHENFYFFAGGRRNPRLPNMKAIRHGNWKLWLKMEDGARLRGTELYNLGNDVGEKHDVSARHPDLVRRLEKMAQAFEDDLRQHIRPLGRLKE